MDCRVQTVQKRRISTGSYYKDFCRECNSILEQCLCRISDISLFGDIVRKDLAYFKQRLLRSPSSSNLCDIDDEPKSHVCSFEEAPKYLASNVFIKTGYRTSTSKEKCIKAAIQWSNETINIWTHFAPFIAISVLFAQDILFNYETEKFTTFERRLASVMQSTYTFMLGSSTIYHVFNGCCSNCYRYWYGWDFVGVCGSIYSYGLGFLFLQFREYPSWIVLYGSIKTILAGIPLYMTFSARYRDERYDGHRSAWIGGFVAFNVLPIVHSIMLRGGFDELVVLYTLPTHLIVMVLLVGSFIIYSSQFPERYLPGRVDFIGHSHQLWHIGTATAVFFARHLIFQYVRAFNILENRI